MASFSRGQAIRYVDGSNVEHDALMATTLIADGAPADIVWISFPSINAQINTVSAVPHASTAGGPPYWVAR